MDIKLRSIEKYNEELKKIEDDILKLKDKHKKIRQAIKERKKIDNIIKKMKNKKEEILNNNKTWVKKRDKTIFKDKKGKSYTVSMTAVKKALSKTKKEIKYTKNDEVEKFVKDADKKRSIVLEELEKQQRAYIEKIKNQNT